MIDFLLHIDQHLFGLFSQYGLWAYAILFLIVFCETGLIVTPLLPGDSLLFASGLMASQGLLHVHFLAALLTAAAILGGSVNYSIGYFFSHRIHFSDDNRFLKKRYFGIARVFYQKHGGKAIVIGRFMPIVRTFVPFVAGSVTMQYFTFMLYNVLGAIIWIVSFVYLSYFFGHLARVRDHFSLIIALIVGLSILPAIIGFFRYKLHNNGKGLEEIE